MGVPAFYRWLSGKYPKIVLPVVEAKAQVVEGMVVPVDPSEKNPNGFELDNLYLDMNGIVHPCSHPEDKPAPESEDEIFVEVFKYIDRIFCMARPRNLLYMGVDGVAPRAKMNQQRSRRFRAAKEMDEAEQEEERLRREWQEMGLKAPKKKSAVWDHNQITPGTPFMTRLAEALRQYVADRQANHPAWQQVKVIISDASVPGEGEHKIMEFVRRQRAVEGYDPNTRHCIYGLDADLIMLSLATHEAHFYILREKVFFGKEKKKHDEEREEVAGNADSDMTDHEGKYRKPFEFLSVPILREYLALEFRPLKDRITAFEYDLERIIDDFIFLCFFVGNDFLPHLPSLDIRDGAVDDLISVYVECLPKMGGYLTQGHRVTISRLETILRDIGSFEDEVFVSRKRREERRERFSQQQQQQRGGGNGRGPSRSNAPFRRESAEQRDRRERESLRAEAPGATAVASAPTSRLADAARSNKQAAAELRAALRGEKRGADAAPGEGESSAKKHRADTDGGSGDSAVDGASDAPEAREEASPSPAGAEGAVDAESGAEGAGEPPASSAAAAAAESATNDAEEFAAALKASLYEKQRLDDVKDNVVLHAPGWKARYYKDKFDVDLADPADRPFSEQLWKSYVEGLCWVLEYYYRGCPSWKWYFPYHFAPFASDLTDVSRFNIEFEEGTPFHPVEQLMGVLPPRSAHCVPAACRNLMTNPDSEIAQFYPRDFKIDMDGKKLAWQGVALLPFIDEDQLLAAVQPRYGNFTDTERRANEFGVSELYVHERHPLYAALIERLSDGEIDLASIFARDPSFVELPGNKAIFGSVVLSSSAPAVGDSVPSRVRGAEAIARNASACFLYEPPAARAHVCSLLPGVQHGDPVLTEQDAAQGFRSPFAKFGILRGRGASGSFDAAADRMIRHAIGARGRGRGSGPEYGRGRGFGPDRGRGRGFGPDRGRGRGFGPEYGRGRGFGPDRGRGRGFGPDRGRGRGFGPDRGRGRGGAPHPYPREQPSGALAAMQAAGLVPAAGAMPPGVPYGAAAPAPWGAPAPGAGFSFAGEMRAGAPPPWMQGAPPAQRPYAAQQPVGAGYHPQHHGRAPPPYQGAPAPRGRGGRGGRGGPAMMRGMRGMMRGGGGGRDPYTR